MRAVVIIPARRESTRFPGKMLADLGGKPLIVATWAQVRHATRASAVVVATDDEEIAAAVRAAGGEAVLTPRDCPSGTDRCAVAARTLGEVDVVVNVQGDEPLIDPAAVDALLDAFDEPAVEMATLARPLEAGEAEDPNVVKVVLDLRGDALYFSRASIPWPRDGGAARKLGRAHVGVYGYRFETLQALAALPPSPLEQVEKLEQLRALENGTKIRVVETDYRSIGVDTPEELERVRAMIAKRGVR